MRTTVTLDPDVEALVRRTMRERGLTFKQAVNLAIREGLRPGGDRPPVRTQTFSMGNPTGVPLTRALQLAGDLEDEELARKIAARK
ncbi:MAG TPA: antitoxin [Actinomycetota bacterium]